jgi:thiamine-monophosphate kinase
MIDELSALRRIKERFESVSKSVLLGIGDDAAAVKIHPERLLLATTDSQVEGVHFIKGLISAKDLGRKSVAVSVSDIGAMGGIPKFFLSSIGFSKEEDESFLEDLMDGFHVGAEEFKVELIGGNLSASDRLFLDTAVLGEVEPHLMVKRSGAKAGDSIYVSGTPGDSALGLKILQNKEKIVGAPGRSPLLSFGEKDDYLISRHVTPQPRLTLGRGLAKGCLATSMIDISDGLILDLERITVEYGLGAEIYVDQIPISSYYRERVGDFIRHPYELALSGGEDYELLFTSPKQKNEEIKELSLRLNIEITEIGHVTPEPHLRVLDSEKKEVEVKGRGFIHFNV